MCGIGIASGYDVQRRARLSPQKTNKTRLSGAMKKILEVRANPYAEEYRPGSGVVEQRCPPFVSPICGAVYPSSHEPP